MRKICKKFVVVLSLILALSIGALIGCNQSKGGEDSPQYSLILSQKNISTYVGDVTLVKVTNVSKDAEVQWTSSDESVAIVNDGKIESLREGTAKITATYKEYAAECTVNVGFGNLIPRLVIKNASSSFKIGKSQTAFPFEVKVLFNGKEFSDVNISCSTSGEVLNIGDDLSISPLKAGVEDVFITGTWRGYSIDRFPSLFTKIQVTVVDELYFWINGAPCSDISLFSLAEHDGVTYGNETQFNITGEYNGQALSNEEIQINCPDFVKVENGKLIALKQGTGKVTFECEDIVDDNGQKIVGAVNVTVNLVKDTFETVIDYYSTNVGTYKDQNDGYKNKSVIETVFNGLDADKYALDTLQAHILSKQLTIKDGKIFGFDVNYDTQYNTTVTLSTDNFSIDVDMVIYGLVIQEANDLKNFELKVLKEDDPTTPGIDETEVTCIDGYCALINSIDATGIKIEHEIVNYTYEYTKIDGSTEVMSINPDRYRYQISNGEAYDNKIGKFGFIGNFDGRGNTIFNLDVSVDESDTSGGGGLFCYTLGGVKIYDVAFKNLNNSNACGLVRNSEAFAPLNGARDPLGVRASYAQYLNVYIHLSPETTNPKGALAYEQIVNRYRYIVNVIIDASAVRAGTATEGGVLANKVVARASTNSYYRASNVFVISPEIPAAFDTTTELVGRNLSEKDNKQHGQVSGGKLYSHDFYIYSSYEEMMEDNHDFAEFSQSWMVMDYPVFITAKEAVVEFNDVVRYNDTIIVSSFDEREIKLNSITNADITDISYSDYDSSKIVVDQTNNTVKLANDVADIETTSLTINFKSNDKSNSLRLNVILAPTVITVEDELEISSKEVEAGIKDKFMSGQKIRSVKQTFAGSASVDYNLDENGNLAQIGVKILTDYSDVEKSELLVKTTDLTYRFTNIKAYSHIIDEGQDLNVLVNTTENVTGYYILKNNVNASKVSLSHSNVVYENSRPSATSTRFQGVIDGRGYAIYNFNASVNGLLKHVHSDVNGKSIIRNLAFIHVNAQNQSSEFSILGDWLTTDGIVKTEISNVHVEIDRTDMVEWPFSSNYKGVFKHLDNQVYESFEMTNVYISIKNDAGAMLTINKGFGTITARDTMVVNSTKEQRQASNRFENVLTIAQANPCVYRRDYLDDYPFGKDMYFVYAENTIGKDGEVRRGYLSNGGEEQGTGASAHNPVTDNPEEGSYIYYGVKKYDTLEQVNSSEFTAFISTGYWKLDANGLLTWSTKLLEPNDEDANFDIDWIEGLN